MNLLSALIVSAAVHAACGTEPATIHIVPQPAAIEVAKGSFTIAGAAFDCSPALGDKAARLVEGFSTELGGICGRRSAFSKGGDAVRGVNFTLDASIAPEGYSLRIGKDSVFVRASDYNGVLYAIQTIKQMLPAEIYGRKPARGKDWKLPCATIEDAPRFGYRGVMLDCCRHFFSLDEVRKFIDMAATYKMNRFHWHLTEDQGWRIEIKKYPRLTEVGAWRAETQKLDGTRNRDGIPHGGFYTQDEIRSIVAYADSLGIMIVPEVDLPGHMVAALASYPELGCTGGPYEVRTMWGIDDNVLCPGKESTFEFIEGVLGEVADLFPGEYIHIGGDECPKTNWKKCPDCQARIKALGLKSDAKASAEQRLQNYVTARVQAFLATRGKKIIGWDEILEGELAKGATVMSWRGQEPGVEAAKAGYDVIMTPKWTCYFDYMQSGDRDKEPYGPMRPLSLSKAYSLEPTEGLYNQKYWPRILGVQCNLWTEWVAEEDHLEYMLLPRMLAISEVQWCSQKNKDYERFLDSVREHQYDVFDCYGIAYKRY